MAKTSCASGSWTAITLAVGASTLIEARKDAIHLSTDGTQPADPFEAIYLSSGESVVVSEGLTVLARPWQDNKTVDVFHNAV